MGNNSYVLITAAKNEEKLIPRTVETILSQTCMPRRWVIVSDGSTDGTDAILRRYQAEYGLLRVFRMEGHEKQEGFASKVFALRHAYERINVVDYDFIGILDADVSFEPSYYQSILSIFDNNPKLGISGGYIYEPDSDGAYRPRKHNRTRSVAGAIQLFRRECFEQIGGLQPIKYGGEDTFAEIMARLHGWEVKAFPEHKVFHHKPGYLKRGLWKERFRLGRLDYVLGYHPVYELMKSIGRIPEDPFFAGSVIRLSGYFGAMLAGEDKVPSPEIRSRIKKEQWNILRQAFRTRHVC